VSHAIAVQLAVPRIALRPLTGGTNNRTFLAAYRDRSWIVRVEAAGGVQLRRACNAQMLAQQAGVATPEIVAAHVEVDQAEQYAWMVEERIAGVHFEPMAFEPADRHALAVDLGHQLRKLHSVSVDAFGIMPPDPWDLNQRSLAAWLDRETARIGRAIGLAGMQPGTLPSIAEVYAFLRDGSVDRPRLCHGDCATTNILVNQGRVVALIDWEWAKGGDPAANIAYWAFWQDDLVALDALLAGYQAEQPSRFRARVLAYRVVTAIELISVYEEHGGPEDIRLCCGKLEAALRRCLWAKE
jgi:aminoglycoside phosphotransferase (APT) family kinase protein